MGTTRTCICQNPECQKTFTTNNPNHSGKYCSTDCYKAARWPGQWRFTVPCVQCGKEVERKKHELETSKQVFCSRACHDVGQNDAYQTANRLENLISLCNLCHKRAEDRTL